MIFRLYNGISANQDDKPMIMTGCVQWKSINDGKDSRLRPRSNPRSVDYSGQALILLSYRGFDLKLMICIGIPSTLDLSKSDTSKYLLYIQYGLDTIPTSIFMSVGTRKKYFNISVVRSKFRLRNIGARKFTFIYQ